MPANPTARTADPSLVDALFTNGTVGLGVTAATPGCAAAISDHGVVVYAKGFGLANLATRAPITPTTIMDIGSVSKQFVAASILLLVQGGRVALDDDIHRYVPELAPYGAPMPLRDLLWMESGLPDYINAHLLIDAGYKLTDRITQAQELGVIAKVAKLDFAPGSQYAYSNTNYFLLGLVVSRVSGEPLPTFEHDHLFGPLGMTATSLVDGSGPIPSADAVSYLFLPTLSFKPEVSAWSVVGPGGLHTDVLDLLRWGQNFTSGTVGGQTLLRAQLVPGPAGLPPGFGGGSYAAGLVVQTRGGTPLIWHNGAWEGFRAALLIEPAEQRAVAVTCNMDLAADSYGLAIKVLDAWFGT